MHPRSIHHFDATKGGKDTLTTVLSADQALQIASRLLQHLRSGASSIELQLSKGHLSIRPPEEETPAVPHRGAEVKWRGR